MAAEMSAQERLEAVIRLEVPDRVPVGGHIDAFCARTAGITLEQWVFDADAAEKALHDTVKQLGGLDVVHQVSPTGPVSMLTGPTKALLPGRDLPPDTLWQRVEEERMRADDYDFVVQEGFPAFEKVYRQRIGFAPSPDELARSAQRTRASVERCRAAGIEPLQAGNVSLPFGFFSYARSLNPFLMDLHKRLDKVQAACDASIDSVIAKGIGMAANSSVRRFQIGGSRGSTDFVRPKFADLLFFPHLKKTVDAFVEVGITPVIHLDTNWTAQLDRLLDLPRGKCLVQLDGFTDIFKAKEILGGHMAIMGDVPPALLTLGSSEEVTAYCRKLIEVVGKDGGFILAAGCTVPVDARLENVRAMVDAANRYGWYN